MALGDKVTETVEAAAEEARATVQRGLHLSRLLDQRQKKYWRIRRPDNLAEAERGLEAAQIKYRRWRERNSRMLARMHTNLRELREEVFKVTRGPA